MLFGWKVADGTRFYRRLMLWVGKKSGKTEFLAALGLAFWLFDGEYMGEAYCIASKRDQAKIVFDRATAMVALSPALKEDVQVFKTSLFCPELLARFQPLSGRAEGRHGISTSVLVGDEMHEWPDLELYNILHQSQSARVQPIELLGSTAGLDGPRAGRELFDETARIARGETQDVSTLAVIFAAGEDDPWDDEATWAKALPNLGASPTIRFLREEAAKARDNPRLLADFKRYYLNRWIGSADVWIPLEKWDAGAPDKERWRRLADEMAGRKCFGGLDLSSTSDITALVWVFPPDEPNGSLIWLPRLWVPGVSAEIRARKDRVPYDRWCRDGAMRSTEGDTVDYAEIRRQVIEDAERFDVQMLAVDRLFQGHETGVILQEQGVPVAFHGQGYLSMSQPSKDFERMALASRIDAGGHPALRWMIGHIAYAQDDAGNLKPSKRRSGEKIDGVVAGIMGTGLVYADLDLPKPSVYEKRGAVIL